MIDYSKVISKTVSEIKPSGIRRFFDIANKMEGVISLGVGEPEFRTPWQVRRVAIDTLVNGKTRYTANRGLMELRREISLYHKRKTGIEYNPEREILVTVGGSEAIDAAIRAICDIGDEIIIPTPAYVCYEPMVKLAYGVPVLIKTTEKEGFKLTPEALRAAITERTKAVILPYPSNPTGAVLTREELMALAEVLKGTDICVIADEIYSALCYRDKHVSASEIPELYDRSIVVSGFSKTFAMTGWRLGYALGPAQLLSEMTKIHQFAIMCAPTVSQHAAIEALKSCDSAVMEMKAEYDAKRRIITEGFNKIGLDTRLPDGTFYVFPSIKKTGLTSDEFCERLLMEKKVALVPGTAFGPGGEGHVRASFCYSFDHIREALKRTEEFLSSL